MEDAEYSSRRLQIALPQLRTRHREVRDDEERKKWYAEYEALKVERDALASELAEIYPAFEAKITDLFARMAANDAALSPLHQSRPAGVAGYLPGGELVARSLDNFSRETLSIVAFSCRRSLPAIAWPPLRRIVPTMFG
jgi:hypothetical protein